MKDALMAGVTTVAGTSIGGSITIAVVPTVVSSVVPAAGVAGWLGFTTTVTSIVSAPVTVPVAGLLAAGALLTYGGIQAHKYYTGQNKQGSLKTT